MSTAGATGQGTTRSLTRGQLERSALRSLLPTRPELRDGAAVLTLSLLAVSGLSSVMEPGAPHLLGLWGSVVGLVIAVVTARRRIGPTGTVAVVAALFVLAGGPAAPETATLGALPGPDTPRALVDGLIRMWGDVLTTQPPVPLVGSARVLPYALGFATGVAGMTLARRTTLALAPAAPALVGVAATALLGTREPASVILQGGLLFAIAVGWASARAEGGEEAERGRARAAWAALMLVGVVAAALVMGRSLPLAAGDRFVAREEVRPPFDPRAYPSPLAGFANHRTDEGEERVLFTAEGLPDGALVRLAVMDLHDGVVWIAGDPDRPEVSRYVRIGSSVGPSPDDVPGDELEVTLTVAGYSGVWVPTVGAIESIELGGDRRAALSDAIRYNAPTRTVGSSLALDEGDVIELSGRELPLSRDRRAAEDELVDARVIPQDLPPVPDSDPLLQAAQAAIAGQSAPFGQAAALEAWFQQGGNSDLGGDDLGRESYPGHSLLRLEALVLDAVDGADVIDPSRMIGNDEQYAAAMAHTARILGLPARVVLGLSPEDPTTLRGGDVSAWVEIPFEGHGWIPFFPTPDNEPSDPPPEQTSEEPLAQQEQPPQEYVRPPVEPPDLRTRSIEEAEAPLVPPIVGDVLELLLRAIRPLAPILTVIAMILGAKSVRRRRRRLRGTPVDRIAAGWAEMLDAIRDAGEAIPSRATRTEVSGAIRPDLWPAAPSVATEVDRLMFGPSDLDDDAAVGLWALIDRERRSVRRTLSRPRRVAAALSLASLRPRR